MARKKKVLGPTYVQLIEPVFAVIKELGGSATNDEIRDKIIVVLKLTDEVVDEPHTGSAPQRTELEYQLAWARTYLKNYGAIVNTKRGIWVITTAFSETESVDYKDVIKKTVEKKKRILWQKTMCYRMTIRQMMVLNRQRNLNLGELKLRKHCVV